MVLATLLYITNEKGEYLLMERLKNPNKGLMSPAGGKLDEKIAETPSACAVREAFEECAMRTDESDWELAGIVTERDYPHVGNIMLFLMRYKKHVNELPPDCNEGSFHFIAPEEFITHKIPDTDRKFLWNKILNSSEMFEMTLDCSNYPDIKLL